MKKLLVVAVVMLVASMANAGLLLSVNGTVDPVEPVILLPSETVIIDIAGDGQTSPGYFYLGIGVEGPGSLNISNAVIPYVGSQKKVEWLADGDIGGMLGVTVPFVGVELNDTPASGPQAPLVGKLVDGIVFHCDGPGPVVISLFDGEGTLLDSQLITQIPEPMTMSLLGLGALLIRRK